MDFFVRQDRARRRTAWLVGYFTLGVILTVVAVYVLVAVVFLRPESHQAFADPQWLWQPGRFALVGGITLSIIGLGSLYRLIELASGGRVVAESLGGIRLPNEPRDTSERRLRNVVEEMALASGVTVPDIYLLPEEQGINAFAAGHTPDDAVIGVTRGCLHQLSRDELQGVIAHEFSHILNGDMRLNLRLMGVLFGLLCLALIGRILLHTRGRRNPLPLLGLGLLAIGGIGVFFGRLIKSAISRQREFLADAAAVQFTRNPGGLSGALKRIGGFNCGSRMQTARAEEAGHLFFANGLRSSWSRMFATHPPLTERIRAIDPSFAGVLQKSTSGRSPTDDLAVAGLSTLPEHTRTPTPTRPPPSLTPEGWLESAGQLDPELLARASKWWKSLPKPVHQAVHSPAGATHTVMGLLLSAVPRYRDAQLKTIETRLDPEAAGSVAELAAAIETLPDGARLPIADLCLPALRELSPSDYETFKSLTQALIEEDREINLLEFALQKSLHRHLESRFGRVRRPHARHRTLKSVATECQTLLSVLSQVTSSNADIARKAFDEGAAALNLPAGTLQWQPHGSQGLAEVECAIPALNEVVPLQKRNVLYACARTVLADRQVCPRELELLRAIADGLDCPIPPILPA